MADIRINDLPLEANPTPSEYLAIDGASTRKATIQNVVNSGAPVASQAEAEAGTNNSKRMTPLATKQSIASEVGVTIASQANGALAATAVQPSRQVIAGAGLTGGGDFSVDRTINVGAGTGIDVTADAVGLDAVTQSRLIPAGGNTGQALVKTSATNYDVSWSSAGSGDVVGPNGGVSDNFPVAFNTTTGKLIKAITGSIAALHGVTPAANQLPYFSGTSTAALTTLSAFIRTVLDDTSGGAVMATLGVLSSLANTGYLILPVSSTQNVILQWGQLNIIGASSGVVTLPTAYTATQYFNLSGNRSGGPTSIVSSTDSGSTTQFTIFLNASTTQTFSWISIGR